MSFRKKSRHPFSFKNYCDKPRSVRKKHLIRLKNRLKVTQHIFGTDLYTSHLDINEERPVICCQNFQFSMLGNKPTEIWHVELTTAKQVFWQTVRDIASTKAKELLEQFGYDPYERFRVNGKLEISAFIESFNKPPIVYEELGRRTLRQIEEDFEREIVKDSPPVVHEQTVLCKKHPRGTVVRMVIDEPHIDRNLVQRVAENLRKYGAHNCVSAVPVARESLPTLCFLDQLDHDQVPGALLGWALIEPITRIRQKTSSSKRT